MTYSPLDLTMTIPQLFTLIPYSVKPTHHSATGSQVVSRARRPHMGQRHSGPASANLAEVRDGMAMMA